MVVFPVVFILIDESLQLKNKINKNNVYLESLVPRFSCFCNLIYHVDIYSKHCRHILRNDTHIHLALCCFKMVELMEIGSTN